MSEQKTGHAAETEAQKAPRGYTPAMVAEVQQLTLETLKTMREHPGHVAMSSLLTAYMQIAADHGAAVQVRAAQQLVMTGTGFLSMAAAVSPDTDIDRDVGAIAEAITGFIASRHHGATLDALLIVFKDLALKFPCCTPNAAKGAMSVAEHLVAAVTGSAAPVASSGTVH